MKNIYIWFKTKVLIPLGFFCLLTSSNLQSRITYITKHIMKSKYESKETFLATLQIEDDFKNLIIYLEELELLKDNTKKRQAIKKHLINIVESILKQKQILAINCAAEYDLLFNLKFENETKKM